MGLPLGRYSGDPIPGSRSAANPDGIPQNHPSLLHGNAQRLSGQPPQQRGSAQRRSPIPLPRHPDTLRRDRPGRIDLSTSPPTIYVEVPDVLEQENTGRSTLNEDIPPADGMQGWPEQTHRPLDGIPQQGNDALIPQNQPPSPWLVREVPVVIENENVRRTHTSLPHIDTSHLSDMLRGAYEQAHTHFMSANRPSPQANTTQVPQNQTSSQLYADQMIGHQVRQRFNLPQPNPTLFSPASQSNGERGLQNQPVPQANIRPNSIPAEVQSILDRGSMSLVQLWAMQQEIALGRAASVVRLFPAGSSLPQEIYHLPLTQALRVHSSLSNQNEGSMNQSLPQANTQNDQIHPETQSILDRGSINLEELRRMQQEIALGRDESVERLFAPGSSLPQEIARLPFVPDSSLRNHPQPEVNMQPSPLFVPPLGQRMSDLPDQSQPQVNIPDMYPAQQLETEEDGPQSIVNRDPLSSRLPRRIAGFPFELDPTRPSLYTIARIQGSLLPIPTFPSSFSQSQATMNQRRANSHPLPELYLYGDRWVERRPLIPMREGYIHPQFEPQERQEEGSQQEESRGMESQGIKLRR